MTTPTEAALEALKRVAEKYVAFCCQAGVEADATSLDPTEQLHAQALAALARVRVLNAERREGGLPQGPCKCGAIILSAGKAFLPAGQAHSRRACQPTPDIDREITENHHGPAPTPDDAKEPA